MQSYFQVFLLIPTILYDFSSFPRRPFLELKRDQQRQLEDLMESFLDENQIQEKFSTPPVSGKPLIHLTELKTKKEKILHIVKQRANPNYLTAREIQELFEIYLQEPIGISTIQTNLNRLVDEGFVERQEDVNPLEYRINPDKIQIIPEVLM